MKRFLLILFLLIIMTMGAPAESDHPRIIATDPYMTEAISEAITGITDGHGGPFGSVVVKDGTIVGRGHNQVLLNKDPTAHGEICAIRDACANLNTYDLTGCVLYTTGEPCPMCLFACLWAKIDSVYFGCTIEDNSRIGFRDAELDSLGIHRDAIKDFLIPLDREACLKLFDLYSTLEHTIY